MKEFEDILKNVYDIHNFVPEHISGPLCISAYSNNLDIVVSAPGHVDAHHWVVRFFPKTIRLIDYGIEYIQLGEFCEERFSSKDVCTAYLIKNRADIYKELYEFIIEKYRTEVLK